MSNPLNKKVSVLKGVGKKRITQLAKLDIYTIGDLLEHYPFRYIDYHPVHITDLRDGVNATVKGQILTNPTVYGYGYHKIVKFMLFSDGWQLPVIFFNQPWLVHYMHKGDTAIIYGTPNARYHNFNGVRVFYKGLPKYLGRVYHTTQGLPQKTLTRLIDQSFRGYRQYLPDYLPRGIQTKYGLESLSKAITTLQYPKTERDIGIAQRTVKFAEFFRYQMKLQAYKVERKHSKGVEIHFNSNAMVGLISSFPYELTAAQKRTAKEIVNDMERPIEMNRLLQGDVGSGKTIVAVIAIYATVLSGHQAALMAPTEILAAQHAKNLEKVFKGFNVHIALLTGQTTAKEKRAMLPKIADGQYNVIIGTHALIQPDVKYHDLGLAVIDEQHRFGVGQRLALRRKGKYPNMLAMTATPIPRTLAVTAYGDMDVSVIDQLPGGRKPVKTYWCQGKDEPKMLDALRNILAKGEQVYVVAPMVDENAQNTKGLTNVHDVYAKLSQAFPSYRVGLLHGKMSDDDKNTVMDSFKQDKIQVLVATTVIEVGVDVSNAAAMVIYNADHFGLAQLHQLRGRVGRGDEQAICILMADPQTPNGAERMKVMTDTTDGFIISQKDLELRGPGDIFGSSQSGLPQFKLGDVIDDRVILNQAQQAAIEMVERPQLRK